MTQLHTRYDEQTLNYIRSTYRFDDATGLFLARQLDFLQSKTYDVKRPKGSAFTIMPIDSAVSEGALTHTYHQYDEMGSAKFIGNESTDLPRADVTMKDFTNPIRTIGNAYGYSMQEIRSAQMMNTNLSGKKSTAAINSHNHLINQTAFFGAPEVGIKGLYSIDTVPVTVLPNDGTGSSTRLKDKTPSQIVRDISTVINGVLIQSLGEHMATECWLPLGVWTHINTTKNDIGTDNTILGFLQSAHPGVLFRYVLELTDSNGKGSDRVYALQNSSENYQMVLPMLTRQYVPQLTGLNYLVPVETRFGGVVMEYPLAFNYANGV